MKDKKPTHSAKDGAEASRKTRAQIVEETIERAMRPYVGVLPPSGLRTMRDILEDALTTHPEALAALDELEAEPTENRSGQRRRSDEDPS
jgi:hypothetical protein